jgi:hypothetical protein
MAAKVSPKNTPMQLKLKNLKNKFIKLLSSALIIGTC